MAASGVLTRTSVFVVLVVFLLNVGLAVEYTAWTEWKKGGSVDQADDISGRYWNNLGRITDSPFTNYADTNQNLQANDIASSEYIVLSSFGHQIQNSAYTVLGIGTFCDGRQYS